MNDMTHGHIQGKTFKVGDYVTVDPNAGFAAHFNGVLFRITKEPVGARGVNYIAERADGVQGRGIKGPASALLPADPDAPRKSAYEVLVEQIEATPNVGTVVTVSNVAKINPRHLYVVTAESRKPGCVRLSKLGGGDGSRYWPSIPVANITVVPLSEVAARLANVKG